MVRSSCSAGTGKSAARTRSVVWPSRTTVSPVITRLVLRLPWWITPFLVPRSRSTMRPSWSDSMMAWRAAQWASSTMKSLS